MAMAMGGRAAEEVVFEEISSGAQNDIQRVTQMAQQQVAVFGMSDIIGPLSFDQGGESNTLYRPFSEQTQRMIDVEVGASLGLSRNNTTPRFGPRRLLVIVTDKKIF